MNKITRPISVLINNEEFNNATKLMSTIEQNKLDDYMEAPDILELDDSEKFKDNDGHIVNIETRGNKTLIDAYFLADDVDRILEMPKLLTTIINKNGDYKYDYHYKYFINHIDKSVTKNNYI